MKRFVIAVGFIALLTPPIFAKNDSTLARVTVYWARGGSGSDRWSRQHKCSTGARLREGHCAVDPRRIPYGSQIKLPDGTTLAAVDTGFAVRNRKAARLSGRTTYERNAIVIDRFFETRQQAITWANRNPQFMTVNVLSPAAPPLSRIAPTIAITRPIGLQPNQTFKPVAKPTANPSASTRVVSTQMIVRSPFNKLGQL
jgi:3D (Asp-Asp-Asp) domain-containing protein